VIILSTYVRTTFAFTCDKQTGGTRTAHSTSVEWGQVPWTVVSLAARQALWLMCCAVACSALLGLALLLCTNKYGMQC
jgi:hypothetical protein